MNDDISILLAFYAQCGSEANGHAVAELEPAHKALIDRFIAGKCTEEERRELSAFLLQNPTWIRWVADEVKSQRDKRP